MLLLHLTSAADDDDEEEAAKQHFAPGIADTTPRVTASRRCSTFDARPLACLGMCGGVVV